MNGLPYYKRYQRDLIEGTAGLPFEVKTTYSFVIDLIYLHDGKLPDDSRYIAGTLGCSVRKWNSIRQALIESGKLKCFTHVSRNFLTNYRAIIELESLRKYQDNQREKIIKRWKNNELGDATVVEKSYHTEPDTDKRKKYKKKTAVATALTDEKFNEFWQSYPDRKPTNPKAPARKKFEAAMKRGIDPDQIIAGARAYAMSVGDKAGTEFVAHATTWLNQERWADTYSAKETANGHCGISEQERQAARELIRQSRERDISELP